MKDDKHLKPIGSLLSRLNFDKDKYISQEFQKYGYDLAVALGDMAHKSLYIKLAKSTPRVLLENAKNAVIEAKTDTKGRLFMWKLKTLQEEAKKKEKNAGVKW